MTRALVLVALALLASTGALAKPDGPRRPRGVDAIIIHSLGGPDCQDGKVFHKRIEGDAKHWAQFFARLPIVSIHYVIDRAGAIESGIAEDKVATHANGWNRRSIGIELVNNGDGVDPFPDAQLDALLRLVRELRARHPEIRAEHIRRHSDVDFSTFSARLHGEACTRFRRKLDPGDAFPWERFLDAVRRGRTTLR